MGRSVPRLALADRRTTSSNPASAAVRLEQQVSQSQSVGVGTAPCARSGMPQRTTPSAPRVGCEAVARRTYRAESEGYLSLQVGDRLFVQYEEDGYFFGYLVGRQHDSGWF